MNHYAMGNIYDVLDLVFNRSYLFLTEKSISALQNFLNGYLLYLPEGKNNDSLIDFENFRLSLQSRSDQHSKDNFFKFYFLEKTNGDESKAFDMFFESLRKWKA